MHLIVANIDFPSQQPWSALTNGYGVARFFKTRSLATDAIDAGHVRRAASGSVWAERVKSALAVRVGDGYVIQRGDMIQEVLVLAPIRNVVVRPLMPPCSAGNGRQHQASSFDRRRFREGHA